MKYSSISPSPGFKDCVAGVCQASSHRLNSAQPTHGSAKSAQIQRTWPGGTKERRPPDCGFCPWSLSSPTHRCALSFSKHFLSTYYVLSSSINIGVIEVKSINAGYRELTAEWKGSQNKLTVPSASPLLPMPPELQQDIQQSSWRLHLPETLQAQCRCVTKIRPTAHQSGGAGKGDGTSCKRKLAIFMLPPFLAWNGACPRCWWVSFGHEDKDEWKKCRATRKGAPGSSQAQGAGRLRVLDDPKLAKAVTQALMAHLRLVWKKKGDSDSHNFHHNLQMPLNEAQRGKELPSRSLRVSHLTSAH